MSTRNAYKAKMQAQLDEWSAEIDRLQARASKASAEARIDYEKEIDELKRRRKTARDRFEELNKAGEAAWEDMKDGAENAWAAMSNALRAAQSRF